VSTKKPSPLHQWEQEMIDGYYDYQWHVTLDPLYEKFQSWKFGCFFPGRSLAGNRFQ
jgi:hypothetical protein